MAIVILALAMFVIATPIAWVVAAIVMRTVRRDYG